MKMKKKLLSFLALVCAAISSFSVLAACDNEQNDDSSSPAIEQVDYAAEVKLDLTSPETKKQEVTVKSCIDGDTTHFNIPSGVNDITYLANDRVLKARYIAVNTPESTGKIEEWGKTASNFTKSKLQAATSIVLETNGPAWEVDSTGERHLVWVWYKTAEMTDYRNLNLELLQNGLAVGSKASETRYGEEAVAAINQATQLKLHMHSSEKDPLFYYGDAIPVSIKELRTNMSAYTNTTVAFDGTVTYYDNNGVYVEEYVESDGIAYGLYVYYGFDLSGAGIEILSEGNRVRIIGSLQYWDVGGTYQVSDIRYNPYKKDDPLNIQLLDKENTYDPAHVVLTAEEFLGNIDISIIGEETQETKTFELAEIAINSSVEMKNLQVVDYYTTKTGDNKGAITLDCLVDGQEITVRTAILLDGEGNTVTQDVFKNKTIDVKGIIDSYNGEYQIKVFYFDDIVFH